jgi:hypothetical protein
MNPPLKPALARSSPLPKHYAGRLRFVPKMMTKDDKSGFGALKTVAGDAIAAVG